MHPSISSITKKWVTKLIGKARATLEDKSLAGSGLSKNHRKEDLTHMSSVKCSVCYSSFTSSRYLSLFFLTPNALALWCVFLWLDTYSNPFELSKLFLCRTLTRAVLFPLLPDGMIPVYSFLLTLILDSLLFCPILSYRTRIPYYSLILACSMKFYAYASSSISRQLPVP